MRTSQNTNNKQVFRKYMQEKLAIAVLAIMLALFALIFVLYDIVKNKGDAYNQIVLGHQDYESRTIPYKRGNIVDRNGTYLATSEKVYNLILDPKQILGEEQNYEYMDATLEALNQCFGYDKEEVRNLINEKKDNYYVVYDKQLNADQKEAFETLKKTQNDIFKKSSIDEGGKKRITGVWFEEEYKRVYPNNELACDVIGFSLKDGSGASGGMEQYYNDVLTGVNGREYGYLNDDSNLERVVKPAKNGETLVSTIDVNIQKICQKYIDEWQAQIGSDVAAVIVMDPRTSEVLAMDTNIRYDLNNPYDISKYYTPEEINAMDDKARSDAWYKMWRNFCISDAYEPGSPQKPFTVAGAMEEGIINGNESFTCGGRLEIGGWPIRCVARNGHGPITVKQGLMKSCNVVMMEISRMTGKEIFSKYQQSFGFGKKTGIDLPGEADTASLVYSADAMGPADLATNSFGQNYNCTMIQMAAGYASMINGGAYYEPHTVKEILNDQGAVVRKNDPKLIRETVSESTSNYIKEALFQTVSGVGGTAGAAAVAGYEVGGKTGTAQKQPRSAKNYLVSFIGFAPAHDPEVLIYVILDTPHLPGEEQAHSRFASEIFSKIMGEVLPYMNVFPQTEANTAADEQLANQEEGITNNETAASGEATTEPETDANGETIPVPTEVSYTDEFIDSGGEDYNYPEKLPGQAEGVTPDISPDATRAAETNAAATSIAETSAAVTSP
ncbi:MAG: penicillin-binding protein 2 [Clostridium sp.]